MFQLANNFAHGRACVRIPVNTPVNEPSQNTSHPTYLIMELSRIRLFSDAHFTQQHAETVHVHLEEWKEWNNDIYNDSCIKYGHDLRDNTCKNGKPLLKSIEMLFKPYTVNSLLATTSRKRPPPVNDHFANNRFVSQSNTVSKTLS